jgi:hypothetical protein
VNCGSGEATLPGTKYSFDRGLSKEDILIHIYFILFYLILFYYWKNGRMVIAPIWKVGSYKGLLVQIQLFPNFLPVV